jgi:hypothetical protein
VTALPHRLLLDALKLQLPSQPKHRITRKANGKGMPMPKRKTEIAFSFSSTMGFFAYPRRKGQFKSHPCGSDPDISQFPNKNGSAREAAVVLPRSAQSSEREVQSEF